MKQGESYDIEGDSVTLNFSIQVCHLQLHTNQGFLLCYKWFSRGSIKKVASDLCKSKSFALKAVGCQKERKKSKRSKKKSKSKRQGRVTFKPKLPKECRPW
ncbi:hypothetical protein ElyMa_006524300 [Elysia marginata]|uniref:Uncharacterized protein n=1 Tax=Elysia marginata TaxID=1093978 RepID=A0AAV4I6R0_9GAST|nr:hypothetical protein ElyMa_006524300 [Elysia marginata]